MLKQRLVCGRLLIDGTGRAPLPDGAVLIRGGKIAIVDTRANLFPLVESDEVIDCGENVLLPGLIDCHNHLSLDVSLPNYLDRINDRESELTLRAVKNLDLDLRAGVTTMRCMGDRNFLDVFLKKVVDEGRIPGPRLVVATRGIRAGHGHGFLGLPCDGPEEIRRAVRENLKAGADLLKFYVTGTVQGKNGIPCFLSKEEIRLIVDEAKRFGVKTAVHCIGGIGLELCLEAGVDSVEHAFYITDREIELFLKTSSWLVLTPSEFLTDKTTLPSDRVEGFRRDRAIVRERMRAIISSGIPYAVGTDGVHGGLVEEVVHIIEAGAGKEEALKAVTLNAAIVCGLGNETGSLEIGKVADIIAVSGNPLEDIKALTRIRMVIKKGELLV